MEVAANGPKSLGLAACTAVVVGNMVGSGFYLSPAVVAPYGGLAIVSWVVMGIGAICLGLLLLLLGIPVYVWQRQRSQSITAP